VKIGYNLILTLCLALLSKESLGQRQDIDTTRMLQLSGVVVSEQDLTPMPYITVYDKSIGRGVIADYYGYFSMVSFPGDTLFFSYYGYKTSTYIVPDSDAIRRAQRELSGESLAFVAARLDADASLASGLLANQRNTKLYTNGQLPVNNLLNPYSWAKLVKDWKEGKLKIE